MNSSGKSQFGLVQKENSEEDSEANNEIDEIILP